MSRGIVSGNISLIIINFPSTEGIPSMISSVLVVAESWTFERWSKSDKASVAILVVEPNLTGHILGWSSLHDEQNWTYDDIGKGRGIDSGFVWSMP